MTDLAREAERLEALARGPLQPHRELLLELAARLRALRALGRGDREGLGQLELEEAA
jgi:hypothetical protein